MVMPAVVRHCRWLRSPANRLCSRPPGENVTDFEQFHPDRGKPHPDGDILTLIEQAEAQWDKAEADRMAKKFIDQEDFTFEDFLSQMQQILKLGSMKKLLMMMPGAA